MCLPFSDAILLCSVFPLYFPSCACLFLMSFCFAPCSLSIFLHVPAFFSCHFALLRVPSLFSCHVPAFFSCACLFLILLCSVFPLRIFLHVSAFLSCHFALLRVSSLFSFVCLPFCYVILICSVFPLYFPSCVCLFVMSFCFAPCSLSIFLHVSAFLSCHFALLRLLSLFSFICLPFCHVILLCSVFPLYFLSCACLFLMSFCFAPCSLSLFLHVSAFLSCHFALLRVPSLFSFMCL